MFQRKAALDQPGNTLDNAIRENVILNVAKVKAAAPIIGKLVDEKKVRVIGAVYNLADGRIDLLD
jgi:carbonic anhydrase